MKLTAPGTVVFVISLVLTALGVASVLGLIHGLPFSAFWVVVAGYAVLAAGNLFRGM